MTIDFRLAVPVLRASNLDRAHEFYCERLGFTRDFLYQPHADSPDPAYMGLSRGDAHLHVSSFGGDGLFGTLASFYVSDIDTLFAEYSSRGVKIDLEPTDQTWGMREIHLKDPDGNRLRFMQARQD